MASALWLSFMEPRRLAPFLSLPVQVMVTPVMMAPALPGQRFFTPGDEGKTIAAALSGRDIYYLSVTNWESVVLPANRPPAGPGAGPAASRQPCGISLHPAG